MVILPNCFHKTVEWIMRNKFQIGFGLVGTDLPVN